jgi:hypothetical protein
MHVWQSNDNDPAGIYLLGYCQAVVESASNCQRASSVNPFSSRCEIDIRSNSVPHPTIRDLKCDLSPDVQKKNTKRVNVSVEPECRMSSFGETRCCIEQETRNRVNLHSYTRILKRSSDPIYLYRTSTATVDSENSSVEEVYFTPLSRVARREL